ncbi:MAG: tetratricopeptide repeat protein [Steroidobacteraceae bacterium]
MLADLDHANIARLIDAGESEDGHPYLVMEYVQGKAIDAYCDEQRLSIDARLRLFLQLCAAVQYAHQHLIIHRDLKPANILVTAEGVSKLLDFGIAKLLAPSVAAPAAAITRVNDRLLTPKHAAPEQILGLPATTATDVYALGTLLYQLLTGMHPFSPESAPSHVELERLVCGTDPLPPSTMVRRALDDPASAMHEKVARIAARHFSAHRLVRHLTGDLDAICMRALRKAPQERYGSVEQLANDIRRHLASRPIAARRQTWIYRSQRFVHRHTLAACAAAAGVGVVVAFAIATSAQAQRIAIERDRATQESNRAEAVSTFMLEVFGTTKPLVTRGTEVTARELLDQAAQRIDHGLSQQPEVQARLLEGIGRAYRQQGHPARAASYLKRALQLRKQMPQTSQVILANTHFELSLAQRHNGEWDAAWTNVVAAADLFDASGNRSTFMRARTTAAIGRMYLDQSDWRKAEKHLASSAVLMRSIKPREPSELIEVLRDLAAARSLKGDAVAAEKTAREAVALSQRSLERLHPIRVSAEFFLAELLAYDNSDQEAKALLEDGLKARRILYGARSSEVADALDVLAGIEERQGRHLRAEQLLREALDIKTQSLGPNHFLVGYEHTSLGVLLLKQRKPVAAEQELRASLRIYAKSLPADHQYVASAEHVLGETLIALGRYREAEQVLIGARDRWVRAEAGAWRVARTLSALGEAIYRQRRRAEGERLLQAAYRELLSDNSATPDALERSRERLMLFYRETGQTHRLAQLMDRGT